MDEQQDRGASSGEDRAFVNGAADSVSAVPASIPSADGDGTRGPEWAEMEARHKEKGVIKWHFDRLPGVTDEQLAASMNRTDRWLSVRENRVASALGGRAFMLRDTAECTLRRVRVTEGGFEPVELSRGERKKAEDQLRFADLLDEAAEILLAQGIAAPSGGETAQTGSTEGKSPVGTADAPTPTPTPEP